MSGIKRSRVRVTKQCGHCRSDFSVPNYRKDSALYCSRKCLALASRSQCVTTCHVCETEFTHISSRANKAKYCSTKCYNKAQIDKGTVEYTCAHCDKKFMDSPSHKRKYCSRSCINKANKSVWRPDFTTVRKVMVNRNMLTKCERCGFDKSPNILGVHHKDRNHNNNELSNLEVLCPNCHSEEHNKHICHRFSI